MLDSNNGAGSSATGSSSYQYTRARAQIKTMKQDRARKLRPMIIFFLGKKSRNKIQTQKIKTQKETIRPRSRFFLRLLSNLHRFATCIHGNPRHTNRHYKDFFAIAIQLAQAKG